MFYSPPGDSPILYMVKVTFLSTNDSSLSACISTRTVSATFSSSSIWNIIRSYEMEEQEEEGWEELPEGVPPWIRMPG